MGDVDEWWQALGLTSATSSPRASGTKEESEKLSRAVAAFKSVSNGANMVGTGPGYIKDGKNIEAATVSFNKGGLIPNSGLIPNASASTSTSPANKKVVVGYIMGDIRVTPASLQRQAASEWLTLVTSEITGFIRSLDVENEE